MKPIIRAARSNATSAAFGTHAGEIIESECARAISATRLAARTRQHYTAPVDADWVQGVAEYGRRLYREKSSVPAYIAKRDKLISAIIARLFERFAGDQATLLRVRHLAAAADRL